MNKIILFLLLFGGCASPTVSQLPEGHPARSESEASTTPALRPYLTVQPASSSAPESSPAPQTEMPMDHSKMKMEGM